MPRRSLVDYQNVVARKGKVFPHWCGGKAAKTKSILKLCYFAFSLSLLTDYCLLLTAYCCLLRPADPASKFLLSLFRSAYRSACRFDRPGHAQHVVPMIAQYLDLPQTVFAALFRCSHCRALILSSSVRGAVFSSSSAKPGAPCRRGSGGRRSFSVSAMGDGGGSFIFDSKARKSTHIKRNEATISTKRPTTNLAMPRYRHRSPRG